MKTIVSDLPYIDTFRTFQQDEQPDFKPRGSWYAYGAEWLEYCVHTLPDRVKGNWFHIELDMNTVLKIETVKELRSMLLKYYDTYNRCPDWKAIAKDYNGIEIINPRELVKKAQEKGLDYSCLIWIPSWDVSGGCIWNFTPLKYYQKYDIPIQYRQEAKKQSQLMWDW